MTKSELVVYEDPQAVRHDLDAMRQRLEEVLPSRVDPDRFLRVAAQAIVSNPTLMQCTRLSLLTSIQTAAQLGLEPSGLLGSAYLVPYKVQGRLQAQLIPGYRGLIDLARRSGEIDAIWANVVRLRDRFRLVQGSEPGVEHEPFVPNPTDPPEERDPGPYIGAYMVAVLQGGTRQVEWMTYDDIEAIRKRSKAATAGPWVTDWSEMARKTVVRRGSKYLPLTTDFRTALELDEMAEKRAEPLHTTTPTNKATQMLLDKAARRASSGQDAPLDTEGEKGPEQEDSEAQGQAVTVTEGEMPPPPETAAEVCGDIEGSMGPCTRMPGHTGGHQEGRNSWPRQKGAK